MRSVMVKPCRHCLLYYSSYYYYYYYYYIVLESYVHTHTHTHTYTYVHRCITRINTHDPCCIIHVLRPTENILTSVNVSASSLPASFAVHTLHMCVCVCIYIYIIYLFIVSARHVSGRFFENFACCVNRPC